MISNSIHFSKPFFLNSKGERVDPKTLQKPIDDTIGNNPDNAIDYIDDLGKRVTMSKKEFMGIVNSIYHLDTSSSKQDFVDAFADVGGLTVGLIHPLTKEELLSYMNKHTDIQTTKSHNQIFNSLHKVGIKLTKEELLEILKKNQENKESGLNKLEQTPKIDTQTLLKSQKNIESIQQKPTVLEQLLTK